MTPKPYVPNILACLVHQPYDCAVDLVRNLNHLAPESLPIMYVDAPHLDEYLERWPRERLHALLYPTPRRIRVRDTLTLGIYPFAFDVMRFALAEFRFDAVTMVDSDQLLVKSGFTETILEALRQRPRCGLLGSAHASVRQEPDSAVHQARKAHRELPVWLPFLERFPGWQDRFVHYSFWLAIVVAGRAVPELISLVDTDPRLPALAAGSTISALEEVLIPTLVRLLGWELAPSPASFRHCTWREPLSIAEVESALAEPDCFWIHPVARSFDDPVRSLVRRRHNSYQAPARKAP